MGRKEEILEKVRSIAAPLAAQEGLELVDVALGGAGRTELTLFIDKLPGKDAPGSGLQAPAAAAPPGPAAGDRPASEADEPQAASRKPQADARQGVTLDDCAAFSRIVSAVLDVEDPLDGAYELVVSSPGLDRPLRTPEHFAKYAGQRCRVKAYGPIPECNNLKTFVGTLLGWDAEKKAIRVDVDGKVYAVPHAQVSKANLEPVFDL